MFLTLNKGLRTIGGGPHYKCVTHSVLFLTRAAARLAGQPADLLNSTSELSLPVFFFSLNTSSDPSSLRKEPGS